MRRARRTISRPVGVMTTSRPPRSTSAGAERGLELADLHGKRRLADVDRRGGAAEVARVGEGGQVAELLEGEIP